MTDKKYKLTISILASNRKDTLPKTLESIKPILDNVSSELIITDTGCDDELLGVIRRYTDKIVKFQWCNDFAKARNVGLKMAQGQWFMFLDDDEWFEDVEEIVRFFNDDECEKYNVFHYIVRNYADMEASAWQDVVVERGIKLDDEIEFVDCIHEHFSKVKPPIKLLDCYVHHYGYVYKTDEDRKKHFMRNYPLLVKQLEGEPNELRHYIHIISACNNVRDYEKSLEWTWKALDMVDRAYDKSDKKYMRDTSSLYANVVHCEFFLDRLEDAVKHGEEFIEKHAMTELAKCMIYSYLANSYLIIRKDKEALERLRRYFELYEYLEERFELKMAQSVGVPAKAYTWTVLNRMWYFGMMKATQMHNEEMVLYLMDKLKYLSKVQALSASKWQSDLIKMMKMSEYKEAFVDTVLVLMDEPKAATTMCEEILKIKDEDEQCFMELVKYLVDNDSTSPYIKALRTIYFGMTGEVDRLREINRRLS